MMKISGHIKSRVKKWDWADRWLAIAFLFYLITFYLVFSHPDNIYLEGAHFVADAAFVGGMADLFAVTAIFEHPLGLRIPNTAILPSKKKAFAEGAAQFVKGLLSEETVIREIRGMDILGMIAIKLKDPKMREAAISYLLVLIKDRLEQANQSESIQDISNIIRQKLRTYRTKDMVRHGISWLKEDHNGAQALEWVAPMLKKEINSAEFRQMLEGFFAELPENEGAGGIRGYIIDKAKGFFKTALEKSDIVNYKDAAEVTQKELLRLVADLGVRDSETQRKVLRVSFERTDDIAKDKRLIQSLDDFRMKLIDRIPLEDAIREIFSRLWNDFKDEENRKNISERTERALRSHIAEVLRNQFGPVLNALRNDADLQEDLDGFLKKMASEFATNIARPKVAKIVKRVLDNMQDDQLNEIVRSKIREDLMFIRINGVIVGGLIGAILFTCVHAYPLLALK